MLVNKKILTSDLILHHRLEYKKGFSNLRIYLCRKKRASQVNKAFSGYI